MNNEQKVLPNTDRIESVKRNKEIKIDTSDTGYSRCWDKQRRVSATRSTGWRDWWGPANKTIWY